MHYCADCQVLSPDGEKCPLCGGKKLRQAKADDPILLITESETEVSRITAAFDDADIPHMERTLGTGGYTSIILGQSRCAEIRVFVPFGEIEHAKEVLRGIGAIKQAENDIPSLQEDLPCKKQKEEATPMSRGRRLAVRIFSIVLFIAIIWFVVVMADNIAAYLKSAFHLFQ